MVDGKAHDFDTGKAGLDINQERRIRTVEPVYRLRWVADEEQIITAGAKQVDDAVLYGIEILRFVDQ